MQTVLGLHFHVRQTIDLACYIPQIHQVLAGCFPSLRFHALAVFSQQRRVYGICFGAFQHELGEVPEALGVDD